MNSYERIMKTLRFEEPDRVPVCEFFVAEKIYKSLMPEARDQHDFDLKYEQDLLAVRCRYRTTQENSDGSFVDEWGITYKKNKEEVPHAWKGLINDVDEIFKLNVPDPNDPYRFGELEELVRQYKGQKAISFHLRAMFMWSALITGLDNFLAYMMIEPEFVDEMLDRVLEKQLILARNAIRLGADIIVECDDYAFNNGPLFSPDLFDRFITPRLKKFSDVVHAEGAYMLKHTDGNIMKIMDSLIAAKIDGLQSIDPIAGMSMSEMKNLYDKRLSLWGNLDCGNLLTYGNEHDVEEAVKQCIKDGAPGGGFVFMSCNSIPYSAKPENFAAMLRYARQYGSYPIRL